MPSRVVSSLYSGYVSEGGCHSLEIQEKEADPWRCLVLDWVGGIHEHSGEDV